jgi:1,4-dihydroxy-2-naphthoate polyprenyltransferase
VSAVDHDASRAVPWRLWVRATRPADTLTSLVPAAAGGISVLSVRGGRPWLLVVALLALACVHAATDVANDVEDTAHGVDPPEKERNSRIFSTGLMSLAAGRRLYLSLAAAGTLIGIVICLIEGPALLVIGFCGVAGGLLYTAGPRPYKHLGLGEVLIVWLMGPFLTQGAATAVTGSAFSARAFWLGACPGLMVAAMLAANNLTDLSTDAAAGARTLAVRIGFSCARIAYVALLLAAPAAAVVLWICGVYDAWILLVLIALAPIGVCLRRVVAVREVDDPRLGPLTMQTAQAHLLLSVTLVVAVVLART